MRDFHLIASDVSYEVNGYIIAELSKKYYIHFYLLQYKR